MDSIASGILDVGPSWTRKTVEWRLSVVKNLVCWIRRWCISFAEKCQYKVHYFKRSIPFSLRMFFAQPMWNIYEIPITLDFCYWKMDWRIGWFDGICGRHEIIDIIQKNHPGLWKRQNDIHILPWLLYALALPDIAWSKTEDTWKHWVGVTIIMVHSTHIIKYHEIYCERRR